MEYFMDIGAGPKGLRHTCQSCFSIHLCCLQCISLFACVVFVESMKVKFLNYLNCSTLRVGNKVELLCPQNISEAPEFCQTLPKLPSQHSARKRTNCGRGIEGKKSWLLKISPSLRKLSITSCPICLGCGDFWRPGWALWSCFNPQLPQEFRRTLLFCCEAPEVDPDVSLTKGKQLVFGLLVLFTVCSSIIGW